MGTIAHIREQVRYAEKSFRAVLSGFSDLEVRDSEEFVSVTGDEWDTFNDPYFVCARFRNARHIPLPFLVRKRYGGIQSIAIGIAGFLNPQSLKDARAHCARYVEMYLASPPQSEDPEYVAFIATHYRDVT